MSIQEHKMEQDLKTTMLSLENRKNGNNHRQLFQPFFFLKSYARISGVQEYLESMHWHRLQNTDIKEGNEHDEFAKDRYLLKRLNEREGH